VSPLFPSCRALSLTPLLAALSYCDGTSMHREPSLSHSPVHQGEGERANVCEWQVRVLDDAPGANLDGAQHEEHCDSAHRGGGRGG
jgi:hypothetical protein